MAKDSGPSDFGARGALLVLFFWVAPSALALVAAAEEKNVERVAGVAGEVTLTAADGATFRATGVRLTLNCDAQPSPRTGISDEQGAFRFDGVHPDNCRIVTELQGFKPARATIQAGESDKVQLHLEVEPIFSGVTVKYGGPERTKASVRRKDARCPAERVYGSGGF